MPISGFDYKTFAENMYSQAQELVPSNISAEGKEYICSTLLKFANIAGEALDKSAEFNADQAMFITQVIAEWTFHKCVDLVNSGIPRQFWDPTIQKIAMVIFEVAQNAQRQNVPAEHALAAIEQHVKRVYTECMEELKNKNLIDDELLERAVNQSNIDKMAENMSENPEGAPQEEQVEEEPQQPAAQNIPPQQNQSNIPQPQRQYQNQPQRAQGNQTVPDIPRTRRGLAGLDEENAKTLKMLTVAMLFQRMQQDKVQVILDKFQPDEAGEIIRYMGVRDLTDKLDARTVMQCLVDFKDFLPASALEDSPSKIVNKIKEICADVNREKLEKLLQPERALVRRFVFSALEDEIVKIPPKVACVLANYIENGV